MTVPYIIRIVPFPVHICLIVTNQHFKTNLLKSIRHTLPLALVIGAGAVIVHLGVRLVFNGVF